MKRTVVASIEGEFLRYKSLGEGALAQLSDQQLAHRGVDTENSVATIVWHIGGNLRSRFTDFLTADGEKPWRDREGEFERRVVAAGEVTAKWNEGWAALTSALAELNDDHLERTVLIRGTGLSVLEALHRSLAHIAYHVGQIVYVAKGLKAGEWTYLSIAPGQTAAYNQNPTKEKAPRA
jgi:hypothetical protein